MFWSPVHGLATHPDRSSADRDFDPAIAAPWIHLRGLHGDQGSVTSTDVSVPVDRRQWALSDRRPGRHDMTIISDHVTDAAIDAQRHAGATPPVVEISVLGGFQLVIGGRDVAQAIGRRDATRLAKFLALAPNRRAHREQLVDALWPESSFESGAEPAAQGGPLSPQGNRSRRQRGAVRGHRCAPAGCTRRDRRRGLRTSRPGRSDERRLPEHRPGDRPLPRRSTSARPVRGVAGVRPATAPGPAARVAPRERPVRPPDRHRPDRRGRTRRHHAGNDARW